MPYIKPERRQVFDAFLEACAQEIETEGDLNLLFLQAVRSSHSAGRGELRQAEHVLQCHGARQARMVSHSTGAL